MTVCFSQLLVRLDRDDSDREEFQTIFPKSTILVHKDLFESFLGQLARLRSGHCGWTIAPQWGCSPVFFLL